MTDFETRQALPSRAGEDAREMADHLRALLTGSASLGAMHGTASGSETAVPDWVRRLIDAHRERIRRDARGEAETLFAVSYEPHAGCFFNGDDPLGLLQRAPNLLALHIEAREAWPPLRELDPYSCNLRLLAISAGPQTELASLFRLVPDQVRIIAVPQNVLPAPTHGQEHETDGLVRAIVEEQRQVIAAAQGAGGTCRPFRCCSARSRQRVASQRPCPLGRANRACRISSRVPVGCVAAVIRLGRGVVGAC